MAALIDRLKDLFSTKSSSTRAGSESGEGNSDTVGGMSEQELDKLPASRVQELAGHAPEQVDT